VDFSPCAYGLQGDEATNFDDWPLFRGDIASLLRWHTLSDKCEHTHSGNERLRFPREPVHANAENRVLFRQPPQIEAALLEPLADQRHPIRSAAIACPDDGATGSAQLGA
jgi:hypothetical protein